MENKKELEAIRKDKSITLDRMKYEKNKIPAYLTYLGIVFNVLYFVSIYRSDGAFYYRYLIGVSVIVNLVFLLASFLSSEGIKNYKKTYGFVLIALGVVEIIRIFVFPVIGHNTDVTLDGVVIGKAIETKQFIFCLIWLIGAAASMILAGIVGILRTNKLNSYLNKK